MFEALLVFAVFTSTFSRNSFSVKWASRAAITPNAPEFPSDQT